MAPRFLFYAQRIVIAQIIACAIWLACVLIQPPSRPLKYAGSPLVGNWRDGSELFVLKADGRGTYTYRYIKNETDYPYHYLSYPLTWQTKNGAAAITYYSPDRSIEIQCSLDADQKTLHQTLLTVHRSFLQQERGGYDAIETFHWKETLKKE